MNKEHIKRGEIRWIKIEEGKSTGEEMRKRRPAVILSVDAMNDACGVVSVVYLSSEPQAEWPVHVEVNSTAHITNRLSTALCEHLYAVDKSRVGKKIRDAKQSEMHAIEKAVAINLGISGTETEIPKEEHGLSINELARKAHENAVAHGFWDGNGPTFGETVALCHSELSEALEEWRDGRPMLYVDDLNAMQRITDVDRIKETGKKPEGVAVEMADAILRTLDWAGKNDVDMEQVIILKHEYNVGRTRRHGGKRL